MVRVVRNGVAEAEFEPVVPRPDATDIVCVGELRPVKAIDVLIEALAILKAIRPARHRDDRRRRPGQRRSCKAQAERLGIADQVRFIGHCPARHAFAMGRMLVIPSRAESLPYVVLEAAAAGLPIIATRCRRHPGNLRAAGGAADPAGRYRRAGRAPSTPRLDDPPKHAAQRRVARRSGCAANFRCERWSRATSPPTAKRSRPRKARAVRITNF